MEFKYEEEQIGKAIIIFMIFLILFYVYIMLMNGLYVFMRIAISVMVISMLFYYKLKVTIDDYELKGSLGIGIIKKSIPLDSIERCEIGKRKWYYRHGYSLTPQGWYMTITGLDVVRIYYNNGKKLSIGTRNPEELEFIINHEISRIKG